ncbi:TQO small subunit DoxD [Flavobacterium piscisymbiosum]|uniref:DoxX family membrane protein n=1 Tax=Flavobacterium piscisymbiosum TaxID=2893753 RepID=A0ABS8MK73_9FLAO|nr:TQO small subunit DoxD [Flavobacterium sp. F-30]MCC9065371.1 DoxX family membrane protein [Flavobacterium sp. F-30]
MQHQKTFDVNSFVPLALRLVVGWTYFSAFWRRLILENKLIPEEAGYIGEKFNHFLPNALGIKPVIEYLVTHPDALWINMVAFTIIEGIVGLAIMLGFFTRLMSIGIFLLALGILLASGWIGTTCLDEWQIGILGLASGFTLFLSGSTYLSLDGYFIAKKARFTQTKWFRLLGSGELNLASYKPLLLVGAFSIFGLTLFTNQYFHGGVFGTLHNKSVKPKLEISNLKIDGNELIFDVFRVEGVDVYGSFLIGISVKNESGKYLLQLDGNDLAKLSPKTISNYYVAKVKPGVHSLVIPLGAKATIRIPIENKWAFQKSAYTLTLTDISGLTWTESL